MVPAILAYTFYANDITISYEIFYPILFLLMGALSYHASNGIRHFIWDTGSYVSTEGVKKTALLLAILALFFFFIVIFCHELKRKNYVTLDCSTRFFHRFARFDSIYNFC